MSKNARNQRVTLFARISCDTKKMIDDEVIRQKTSQAKLVDQILRQHFEEKTNGKDATTARQAG